MPVRVSVVPPVTDQRAQTRPGLLRQRLCKALTRENIMQGKGLQSPLQRFDSARRLQRFSPLDCRSEALSRCPGLTVGDPSGPLPGRLEARVILLHAHQLRGGAGVLQGSASALGKSSRPKDPFPHHWL